MAGASVASAGLGIMGAVNQNKVDSQTIANHNYNVLLNAQSANLAASNQYGDMGRQFSYEARSAQQEANKAISDAYQAQGTTLASAGTSGFTGSSLTLGSVLSDLTQSSADAESNYGAKMDDLKSSFKSKGKSVQAQAQDRINSMQYQSQPSGAALGLNIANAVVKGAGGVASVYKPGGTYLVD